MMISCIYVTTNELTTYMASTFSDNKSHIPVPQARAVKRAPINIGPSANCIIGYVILRFHQKPARYYLIVGGEVKLPAFFGLSKPLLF